MKKVTLTKNDYTRIYKAITDAKNSKTINSNEAEKLLSELSKAEIVPSEKIDKDVVTMNSEVKLFFEGPAPGISWFSRGDFGRLPLPAFLPLAD